MNAAELIQRMSALYDQNIEIAIKKNQDYANNDEPFANFEACEAFGVPTEIGFMTRMTDKLCRVGNLLTREAAVVDESIFDTLSDLANYAMLLRVWLEQLEIDDEEEWTEFPPEETENAEWWEEISPAQKPYEGDSGDESRHPFAWSPGSK